MLDNAKNETPKELPKDVERARAMIEAFVDILGAPGIAAQYRWLLAINAGALMWMLSQVDKYCLDVGTFWRVYWAVIIILQMVSLAALFIASWDLFRAAGQVRRIYAESLLWKSGGVHEVEGSLEKAKKVDSLMKGTVRAAGVGHVILYASFFLLAAYIIRFLIVRI